MSLKNAAYLLFSFWAIAFTGTHLPGSALRHVSFSIPNLDKIVHFGLFFVLAGLIANMVSRRIPGSLPISLLTLFLATGYAAFDELTQMLVPNRSCDIKDFMADLAGIATGLLVFHVARQIKRILTRQKAEAVS